MHTDERSTNTAPNPQECGVPLIAVASTLALAAAGTMLACSLFASKKRRLSISSQVCLGAVVACAGAMTWKNRQQEVDAARHFVAHVNQSRDARWLRKNPIAYA